MSITENLRKQHHELLEIAARLTRELDEHALSRNASTARTTLSQFSGKLKVHLNMEDRSLYPRLIGSESETVRDTARSFIAEIGGIGEAFLKYLDRWPNSSSIQREPKEFIRETRDILSAVAKRIDKENRDLYPLVDRQGHSA